MRDQYDDSEVGIFEGYGDYESLEDIPEMRPGTDPEFSRLQDWYRVLDLRENSDRGQFGLSGLPDWQADFPAIEEPTETTAEAVERLLSYFV